MTKSKRIDKKLVGKSATSAIAVALALSLGVTGLGASTASADFTPPTGDPGAGVKTDYAGKYYTDYNTFEEAKAAAVQLTREIAQEGDVLLKNNNNALPLAGGEWVSVFGVSSDNLVGASDSSGAFSGSSSGGDETVAAALENAGFRVNPTLKRFYENDESEIGEEVTEFSGIVQSSFKLYDDVAFVVLSREGGEGSDASTVTSEEVEDGDDHVALAKKSVDGQTKTYKHSLMLTHSEIELIDQVKTQFKKVVIITNTSNPMEIDDLKNDNDIDAILHIGRPGIGGLNGFADIVAGLISPSGGLVDMWSVDFTKDPTWYNFGNNAQTQGNGTSAGSSAYLNSTGVKTGTADTTGGTAYEGSEGYYGVDYEEGIYLGYKYYETVYEEIKQGNLTVDPATGNALTGSSNQEKADNWYKDNVAYEYGYGLSYTTFSFNIDNNKIYTDKACTTEFDPSTAGLGSTYSAAATTKKIYVPVTVKNTGSVAGKRTVQVYVSAPYTSGGIEKSAVQLVGFAKTSTLAPNAEETVVVEINVQDMASWDSTASNGDGTNGHYVLDSGTYTLHAMDSAHIDDESNSTDAYDSVQFTLSSKVDLLKDDYSGGNLKNLFTTGDNDESTGSNVKVGDHNYGNVRTADMMQDNSSGMTILSRSNMSGTFPKAPTTGDLTFKDNVLQNWAFWDNFVVSKESGTDYNNDATTKTFFDRTQAVSETNKFDGKTSYVSDISTDPWYKTSSDIPSTWTQATGTYDEHHKVQNNRTELEFGMYVSSAENCPIKYKDMYNVAWSDSKWDDFLNQLTYDELCTVVEFGGYSTVDIASVGKVKTEDSDGPTNWDSSHCWTSADIVASTFNTELAEKQGVLIGNLGLLKDPTSTQTGWYGPGTDIHRSAFSGRNNEYYSQDALQAGYMVSAVIEGVQSKGIVCYVKHCFMNDQETNRGNLFTWANEQTIRETYTKGFQMALQEGGSKGAMVAYGRLGGLSNTNNYNMSTELYQNQWGTNACFVTDGYIGWSLRTSIDMMVRTGNLFELYTTPFVEYLSGEWDAENECVKVDGKESATQWYCVRQAAKSVLYNTANSVGQRNGYSELNIAGGALTAATATVDYSADISIANSLDSDSSFVVSEISGLPAGLECDKTTGKISGSTTAIGDHRISVSYIIDGYITKTAQYTLKVNAALALDADGDDITAMTVGGEFMTSITSTEFTEDKYSSLKYSIKSGTLPEGLTLAENGTISGTPTKAGTYTVVIELAAEKTSSSGGGMGKMGMNISAPSRNDSMGGGSTTETTKVEIELTFVVAGEGGSASTYEENVPYIGENGNWYLNGEDLGVAATGTNGTNGTNGVDGKDGGSAVAGTVLGSIALALVVALGAAGAVLFLKKGKKSEPATASESKTEEPKNE